MKYDWIEIAMGNGGVLTTSRNVHGISATMHRKGADPIRGDHHTTLPDALTSLNEALRDDAADECCPPPKFSPQNTNALAAPTENDHGN